MKIAALCGNMPHYDHGLMKVLKIIQDTLSELDVTVEIIHLGYSQIPYYDGIKAQAMDDIVRHIRESSGVIFACTAQLFAPTAILQTFVEHLELDEYKDALREKNCMLAVVSKSGGERSALSYLSKVIHHLGGYDHIRIGLQETQTRHVDTDAALKEIIEKETEDFYRAARQNRKHIIPRDYSGRHNLAAMTDADIAVLAPEPEKIKKTLKAPLADVYKRLNLDDFNERQEQDIAELTKFFTQKIAQTEEPDSLTKPIPLTPRISEPSFIKPREKTLRELTENLPRCYQPQLSAGINAVIQLSITGEGAFEGYLTLISAECTYSDGVAPNPDLTVIADASVWQDVLKNKYTAQKAFMIGSLRVRGKFTLLTKFDSLFQAAAE